MKKPWDVITEIAGAQGRLAKEAIIVREAKAGNDELFKGLNACFNSFITYGVAKIPAWSKGKATGLNWDDFSDALALLAARKVTGNGARELVDTLISLATEVQWNNWYRLILMRDIRAGFTVDTVNRLVFGDWKNDDTWVDGVAPDYRIPVYKCQLAIDADDRPNAMTGVKQIDTKCDGNRLNIWADPIEKTVVAYSRNGLVRNNFPHIIAQFEKILPHLKEPMVFDGEVMSATFRDLMKQVQRKYDVNAKDATLHLFDWLPTSDFKDGRCTTPQNVRSATLKKFVEKHKAVLASCEFLEYETIDLDTKAGRNRLEKLREEAALAGAEGVMVKKVDAPYLCERSDKWLKIKPVIGVDLAIIDVEPGKEGKKNAHWLGNLICKGHDRGHNILVSVGMGFSNKQREEFWRDRQQLIGRVIEIEADAISTSDDTAVSGFYSLRFPRFKSFRDDK
jgi:hypothetical protein